MTSDVLNDIRALVFNKNPLIHCITNPISINQCANAVLCLGGRPIMAEHPDEAGEITMGANSLMLNLGNITDARMKSMMISAQTAEENGIPYVLDVVGVACSKHRRDFCSNFLKEHTPSVIKGNYSEINALYNSSYKSSGVDADETLDVPSISDAAITLAKKYNATILASGKVDIITDGKTLIYIKNGTPQLAKITGTGCMLGAICASFLSQSHGLFAAACACAVLGICGELSETNTGAGSFMVNLFDNLSTLSDGDFAKYLKLEETEIEKI